MKPNFALLLSSDGIGLLHRAVDRAVDRAANRAANRAAEGWNMLGEASLEGGDLSARLASLREKAAQFEPSGLHCTLVLPNDQIKYIRLPRADISEDDPQQSALDALEGATPYAVEALVIDWALTLDQLHVAAVARETLAEAETFIYEHGFDPVCFVATPDAGDFTGAPYFGVTSTHDAGDPVERDQAPVRVTGSAFMPKPLQPEISAAPESETEQIAPPVDTPNPKQPDAEAPQAKAPLKTPGKAPVTAFTSIREHRDNLPNAAPRLAGAARFFGNDDINPAPTEIPAEIPTETSAETPQKPSEPDFSGVTDAALPDEPAPEPKAPVMAQADTSPAAKSIGSNTSPSPHPAPVEPAGPAPEPTPARLPARLPAPTSEKARMTVFGARDPRKTIDGPGRSWLGLAALVVISLAGLAALASMTFEDGLAGLFRASDRAQISGIPDPGDAPQIGTEAEEIAEEINNAAVENSADEAPQSDATAEATAEDAIDETAIASLQPSGDTPSDVLGAIPPTQETQTPPKPAGLTPDEARSRYAATGIWQMVPVAPQAPLAANLENLYQASIDSAVNRQEAIALPAPRADTTDIRPKTLLSPPAPGAKFNRNSRGQVIATETGALTPEGIRVYAGQPALVPPTRPGATARSDNSDNAGITTNPALLQQRRPRLRPDDLAEQYERSALGGRTLSELAEMRPKLRPKSAQEVAAEIAAGAAANAIDAAVSEVAQLGLAEQAITASLRPATRPKGFSETVARILATQQPQDTPGQTITASAVAATTPGTPTPFAPNIPSSVSIAQQATDENAIKLRKVNLIGVYGSTSSRRALVRLPNGRYRKVVIGDKLDGGKVAAIGDNELRYIKRGRNVVLKMPQS